MHQKLLHRALLLGFVVFAVAFAVNGCIDEPNPVVVDRLISRVRIVHAAEGQPDYDVWIDGIKVAPNLGYKNFHDYIDVKSGVRLIQFTAAGQSDTTNALFASNMSVRALDQMTMFIYNSSTGGIGAFFAQEKFTYADEEYTIAADSARVRVINLCNQNATFHKGALDGEEVIKEVASGVIQPYQNVAAGGSFTCYATAAGAQIASAQVSPASKKRYTYFLMGSGDYFFLVMPDYSLPTYP
jgi:hypothetical protein